MRRTGGDRIRPQTALAAALPIIREHTTKCSTGSAMSQKKRTIHSVTLVAKAGVDPAEQLSLEVLQWLSEQGITARRLLHPSEDLSATLGSETDLVLVFGGDGTVVSVCRRTLGTGAAVAGVNFGRVGFLTELSPDNWREPLERALHSGLVLRPRMSLHYRLERSGAILYEGEVVNEVVVTRGKMARLATLNLSVNSKPFVDLRSDGLILATSTGASGYAGSAGGPLMAPSLNAYIVAAICPYLSSFPPIVLTADTVFSVQVAEGELNLYLTLDGQEAYPLREGDRLEVWGMPDRIIMANFGLKNYFDRLCLAGFIRKARSH